LSENGSRRGQKRDVACLASEQDRSYLQSTQFSLRYKAEPPHIIAEWGDCSAACRPRVSPTTLPHVPPVPAGAASSTPPAHRNGSDTRWQNNNTEPVCKGGPTHLPWLASPRSSRQNIAAGPLRPVPTTVGGHLRENCFGHNFAWFSHSDIKYCQCSSYGLILAPSRHLP
jgi:hypothetical protein